MLAKSKSIYNLVTSDFIMSILRGYLKNDFRITDQRVYVTEKGEKMQWHVDNKLDDSQQTNNPGLIFIFYLNDVNDGYFQLIKNSHRWSQKNNADFSDSFIQKNHFKDIVDFKYPRGSLIIYSTKLIHRAKPIKKYGFERCSLFLQVERKDKGGEPIYLNSSYLEDLSEEKKYYLGFGAEPEYEIFPGTDIKTIPPKKLLKIIAQAIYAMASSIPKSVFWSLIYDKRSKLKKIIKGK